MGGCDVASACPVAVVVVVVGVVPAAGVVAVVFVVVVLLWWRGRRCRVDLLCVVALAIAQVML